MSGQEFIVKRVDVFIAGGRIALVEHFQKFVRRIFFSVYGDFGFSADKVGFDIDRKVEFLSAEG